MYHEMNVLATSTSSEEGSFNLSIGPAVWLCSSTSTLNKLSRTKGSTRSRCLKSTARIFELCLFLECNCWKTRAVTCVIGTRQLWDADHRWPLVEFRLPTSRVRRAVSLAAAAPRQRRGVSTHSRYFRRMALRNEMMTP